MKRYEKTNPVTVPAFLADEYNQLKLENIALKDQLRWRPVSEKPEKADVYFVKYKPYTRYNYTIVTTSWFDGEKFPWHDVVKWLPIPPAQEGE